MQVSNNCSALFFSGTRLHDTLIEQPNIHSRVEAVPYWTLTLARRRKALPIGCLSWPPEREQLAFFRAFFAHLYNSISNRENSEKLHARALLLLCFANITHTHTNKSFRIRVSTQWKIIRSCLLRLDALLWVTLLRVLTLRNSDAKLMQTI